MTEVSGTRDFPRTLWMLWLQGWENAPEVVQRCLRSWQHHNPGWTIRLLDADNLPEWVDLSDLSPVPEEDFPVQAFSDTVRLYLIKTHGGVWADATCFCRRPLDEWLFDHLRSGFFSFERSGGPMSWFLAAAPGNRATALWWDELQTYWTGCPRGLRASLTNPRLIDRLLERSQLLGAGRLSPVRAVDRPLRALGKLLERHPEIRFSPLFRNVLKNAPYYAITMLFTNLLKKHPEVRRIWGDTLKMQPAGLIELGGFPGLCAPISDHARRAIDEQRVPVYKLNWRLDLEEAGPGSFLDTLFSTVPGPVRYTDWQRVAVAAPGAFVPELPASVIVPYRAPPEELRRTLAALERQTYPRELFEVVVVDDGSPEPLERPRETPLAVKVVRQEDAGSGLARARNTGVRTAAHDILLFLDAGRMPEADWLTAHARWHHAVPDAVTLGLFEPSKTDDQLWKMTGGDLGIGRRFYELVGEFNESLAERGGEDTEFGYRACVRGGLLVPVREGFTRPQRPSIPEETPAKRERSRDLQRANLAHLIAHSDFRTGPSGRTFTVPQYVVTIRGGTVPAERLLETVEQVLSGSVHDLVVRVELPASHAGRAWLERHLGPDPRVRVAPSRSALKEFPASPFHVTLPAGRQLHADVVRRLRAGLGTAAIGRTEFRDGSRVSIARAQALHRALRMPQDVFSNFGEVVTIPPRKLRAASALDGPTVRLLRSSWTSARARLRRIGGRTRRPPRRGPGAVAEPLRYNDWRQVAVAAPGAFVPEQPASVIVPYYAQPEELGRTLAALERQTYPRDLFEVVVVDDGSPKPLERPRKTPLNVKVVRQEDLGFGLARARNTGVRSAAHDILLFLDADMMPEAEWLAAHARWHHAVPDALTLGLRAHVPVDGVDAETIRTRPGTLKELFAGRRVDPARSESFWRETDGLTSKRDDLFAAVTGGNLGLRRDFFELVGGFDESFTLRGGEDQEFGYRGYVRGGLLVPVREAFAWHQGPGSLRGERSAELLRDQKLQRAKLAHLIAHTAWSGWGRSGTAGRTFKVPQHVVTIRGGTVPAKRLLETVERVLAGPMHDLVVRLELPEDYSGRVWLECHLGLDPRVRVAPSRPALEEFPASPFHVTLPAGRRLHADVVRRLRAGLGTAVVGTSELPDGSRVSIARAWALHRALRTPWEASDFGDAVTIPSRKLVQAGGVRRRARERRRLRRNPAPPLRPDPGIDAVVDASIDWLRWAQDRSASNDGGVSAAWDSAAGMWCASYPETTGYIVPTLLAYARRHDDADAQHRARCMLDWLVSVQFADGGFPGGQVDDVPQVPVAFNTGQILLGLAAGQREFGGYGEPLRRAADWLAAAQDTDGCWRRYPSPFVVPGEKTYDVHAAWGLLEADRADPGRGYADAALCNIRWALTHQRDDGFFDHCCLDDPNRPLTHTLGYALRGLIEGCKADEDILPAARLTADGLLGCLTADGFLSGRIGPGWRPAVNWACLTGTAQVAACWFLLYEITGEHRYLTAGRSANAFVRRTVRLTDPPWLRGGVAGSWPADGPYMPNRCLSWAAKFCIDANLLEADRGAGGVHPNRARAR